MKSKLIQIVLLVILALLVLTLVICFAISYSTQNSFLGYISGLSTFFVAVIAVITAFLTTGQIALMEKQIEEMKADRLLREQPILIIENPVIEIECPRQFYSPPSDEYSCFSRYEVKANIVNVSVNPAIFVDIFPELSVNAKGKTLCLQSETADRINVITNSNEFHELFAGDKDLRLYDSLRSTSVKDIPKITIKLYYKSITGGFFQTSQMYNVVLDDKDRETAVKWHTAIAKAPVQYKEEYSQLKRLRSSDRKKWDLIWEAIKDDFNKSIGEDVHEIALRLIEIPQEYQLKQISEKEYNSVDREYGFFIGTHCDSPCDENG